VAKGIPRLSDNPCFDVQMERIEVHRSGVTLSCLHGGTGGHVVVLMHGLAGSAQELLPTATSLVPEHRVIAVDQRGHGHSTRHPHDVSRRAYVEDIVAVVDVLANGGPVTLVGQSMGAHTALLVAAWHPDLVRRLVLLEGGVGGGDDYPDRLGSWFASWPVPFPDVDSAVTFLGSTPTAWSWARDMEQRADGLWPRFDANVMRAAITAVAEEARWAEWQNVKAPTLLVRGQHGTIPADEVQRMLTMRPDVEHVVVPGAGHDVHLDQPDAWMSILRTYLDR
jgi:pimeloyl-ACP methyl ester carboxylesterase